MKKFVEIKILMEIYSASNPPSAIAIGVSAWDILPINSNNGHFLLA